ncbi:MAG: hypothetical protein ABW022_19590 [Actinoplanes sp.]
MALTPPQAIAVEVVTTQPTEADDALIARLSPAIRGDVAPAAYLVMIRLQTVPPATSSGWALYISDFRVPKYWQYARGIYFKVYDPQFLADHAGEPLRFSANGTEFIETGLTLAAPDLVSSPAEAHDLPRQDDILRSGD